MELNTWTNPRTGEIRHYLNGWETELAGIEITTYGTGNVSSFHINGHKLANGRAGKFTGKVWVNEEGEVTVNLSDAFTDSYYADIIDGHKLIGDLHRAARELWEKDHAPGPEETAHAEDAAESGAQEDADEDFPLDPLAHYEAADEADARAVFTYAREFFRFARATYCRRENAITEAEVDKAFARLELAEELLKETPGSALPVDYAQGEMERTGGLLITWDGGGAYVGEDTVRFEEAQERAENDDLMSLYRLVNISNLG